MSMEPAMSYAALSLLLLLLVCVAVIVDLRKRNIGIIASAKRVGRTLRRVPRATSRRNSRSRGRHTLHDA